MKKVSITTQIAINIICAISIGMCLISCTARHDKRDRETVQLDSLLERREDLHREKLLQIYNLKKKGERATTDPERYMANKLLFDAYSNFQSDSAMKYADACLDVAETLGSKELISRSKIDKANLMVGTGMLNESLSLMQSIDRSDLTEDLLVDYYGQMIFLYSHLGYYSGGEYNEYYAKEKNYKDSIMRVIKPNHPEYLWYLGGSIIGTDKPAGEAIKALKKKVEESRLDNRQDARDAYMLALLYRQEGDEDNFKKYMTKSAIADVRICNGEISSLEDLAKIYFKEGDIDHAYAYIDYSLNKAITYPNRVKAIGITSTIDEIFNAYREKSSREHRRTRNLLIMVGGLALVLVVSIIIIVNQNRKLSRKRTELDEVNNALKSNNIELKSAQEEVSRINERLHALNQSLKYKNDELAEANYVKEKYIGSVFSVYSNYIFKLESLKNKIHGKLLTRQYKEIEKETSNVDIKEELREFYHLFDTVFLNIYPDFIEDFNGLLEEDKKIYPKEGELLNTELRIYALVRLGITDSIKIAEFLHCSAQTVYNNRFKVRNRAKIDRKQFASAVMRLGSFKMTESEE